MLLCLIIPLKGVKLFTVLGSSSFYFELLNLHPFASFIRLTRKVPFIVDRRRRALAVTSVPTCPSSAAIVFHFQ